jgi:hypothetical protein
MTDFSSQGLYLPRMRQIHVRQDFSRNQVSIYLILENGKKTAKPIEPAIEIVDMPQNSFVEPFMAISFEYAQELLDAMFMAGMRPTAYKEHYDQLTDIRQSMSKLQNMLTGGIILKPANEASNADQA